jgi:hypothetical protein
MFSDCSWSFLLPWGYSTPIYVEPLDTMSFGTIIDICVGNGGGDPRFLEMNLDSCCSLLSNPIKGTYWPAAGKDLWDTSFIQYVDQRVNTPETGSTVAPEMGLNIKFSTEHIFSPSFFASYYSIALEAYVKKNGSKLKGERMMQKFYQTAWKNIGPAADDVLFAQCNELPPPYTGQVEPTIRPYYPKTRTQTMLLWSAVVPPNPLDITGGQTWTPGALPVDGWLADGTVVPGAVLFNPNIYINPAWNGDWVHDTAFPWSRPGKTKTMGHGVVNMKSLLENIIG